MDHVNEIDDGEDLDATDALADAIEGVGSAVCNMFDQFGGSPDASAEVVIDGALYRVSVSVIEI